MSNMEDQTQNKILLIVGRLEGKLDGVINRLDKLNGFVASNTIKINKNENDIIASKAKATLLGAIAGIITSIIGGLIAWFKLK